VTASLPSVRDESTEVSRSRPEARTTDDENSRSRDVGRLRHHVFNKQTSAPGGFDETTIDRLLETFFTIWHPRWPVLHRPSFDWQTAPWDLVWIVCMIAAKLQSHRSSLPGELQEEMAKMLKNETEETVEKGLDSGAAASVMDPEFLPHMQTYILYVLFLLYFGTEVEFAQADCLMNGIVQLLQRSSVFHHPSLHEETTVGSLARVKQESWKMFVPSMLNVLHGDTDIAQDYGYYIPFGCLYIHNVQTEAHLTLP
jgi:Fungal specific transcription factor domain